MQAKILVTANISELGEAFLNDIPLGVYNDVRNRVQHPQWVKLDIGSEGFSGGAANGRKIQKHWPKAAIAELASAVKGAKLYAGTHEDQDNPDRQSFGEVVSGILENAHQKARAFAIGYIDNPDVQRRIHSGELDICSIEGVITLAEAAGGYVVEQVHNVTGVLLADGRREAAGFAGAGVVAHVQELEPKKDPDAGASGVSHKGDDMPLKKSEVKAWIEDQGIKPSDLFGRESLSNDPVISGIVKSSVEEAEEKARSEQKKLQNQLTKLNEELIPARNAKAKEKAGKFIDDNPAYKALTRGQAEVVKELVLRGLSNAHDLDDAKLSEAVNKALTDNIEFAQKMGLSGNPNAGGGPQPLPHGGNPVPQGGGGNNNPFVPDTPK